MHIFTHSQRITIGLHILRIGVAVVFLWFGFSQLFDGLSWVGIVPEWAVTLLHLPPAMIVLLNGLFEVTLGTLLAMNIFTRPIAFLLGLHMALITLDLGVTPSGVRDFGLTAATLALAFLGQPVIFRKPNYSYRTGYTTDDVSVRCLNV